MIRLGILEQDLLYTWNTLTDSEKKALCGSTILITGCGGFLGQYHLSFYEKYANELQLKKVIGIDNFMLGKSPLIRKLSENPLFDIYEMDISDFNDQHLGDKYSVDYVIHMASIASPTYYRLHPLETVDSNIRGLRTLLDAFSSKNIKGFLFYSSSEIYGNPDNKMVPTSEEYWGNNARKDGIYYYELAGRINQMGVWIRTIMGLPLSSIEKEMLVIKIVFDTAMLATRIFTPGYVEEVQKTVPKSDYRIYLERIKELKAEDLWHDIYHKGNEIHKNLFGFDISAAENDQVREYISMRLEEIKGRIDGRL